MGLLDLAQLLTAHASDRLRHGAAGAPAALIRGDTAAARTPASDQGYGPSLHPDTLALFLSSRPDLFVLAIDREGDRASGRRPGHSAGSGAGGSAGTRVSAGDKSPGGPSGPRHPKWRGSAAQIEAALSRTRGSLHVRVSRRLHRWPKLRTRPCFYRFEERPRPLERQAAAALQAPSSPSRPVAGGEEQQQDSPTASSTSSPLHAKCEFGDRCLFAHSHATMLPSLSTAGAGAHLLPGVNRGREAQCEGAVGSHADGSERDHSNVSAWEQASRAYKQAISAVLKQVPRASIAKETGRVGSLKQARLRAIELGYFHVGGPGAVAVADEQAWMRQRIVASAGTESAPGAAGGEDGSELSAAWCLAPSGGARAAIRVLLQELPA